MCYFQNFYLVEQYIFCIFFFNLNVILVSDFIVKEKRLMYYKDACFHMSVQGLCQGMI